MSLVENAFLSPQSTTDEVKKSKPEVAVIGIGSFEQHSKHLPLETDFIIARDVSLEVAKRIGAMILNPLPYSVSLEHIGFAGTVLLKPDTLKVVIRDIAWSVSAWGIRYLVILNFHGGNFILNPTIREWNMERRSPFIMHLEFYNGIKDMAPNLHAGEVETSLLLYLHPEVVKFNLAGDFIPELGREHLTHFGMKGLSSTGVWGYATRATRKKGEYWFGEGVEYLVNTYKILRKKLEM